MGLIGGTTWVSTLEYYRTINQEVNKIAGKNHSAKLLLYSFDFQEVITNKKRGDEKAQSVLFVNAAKTLKAAGADGLMLCANTTHKYAPAIGEETGLPLIHIARETARVIREEQIDRVALLGTLPTMEDRFYKDILEENGIDALVPGKEDREWLDRIIFEELAREEFGEKTRSRILDIIQELEKKGARGAILGCTELPLIITGSDTGLPLFNTLRIHAEAAARFITQTS